MESRGKGLSHPAIMLATTGVKDGSLRRSSAFEHGTRGGILRIPINKVAKDAKDAKEAWEPDGKKSRSPYYNLN